jgi:hypothetical protein
MLAAASVAVGAAPELPAGVTKEEIDRAAAATGRWARADYPFYGRCNGCGTERIDVPERPYRIKDISFTPACNAHDQRYCTLEMSRAEADRLFREDLERIVNDWLDSRIADSPLPEELWSSVEWATLSEWIRAFPPPDAMQVPMQGSETLLLTAEPLAEQTWFRRKLTSTKQQLEECWHCVIVVKDVCVLIVDEAGARMSFGKAKSNREDLTPEELRTILQWVNTYAESVEAFGGSAHEEAQAQQRSYEAWLTEYLAQRPL